MPYTDYEELYDAILDLACVQDDGFEEQPEAAQTLAVLAAFEMEIMGDGTPFFFLNEGWACAGRVAGALREIGMDALADAYEAYLAENKIDEAAVADIQRRFGAREAEMDLMQQYREAMQRWLFDGDEAAIAAHKALNETDPKAAFEERMARLAAHQATLRENPMPEMPTFQSEEPIEDLYGVFPGERFDDLMEEKDGEFRAAMLAYAGAHPEVFSK